MKRFPSLLAMTSLCFLFACSKQDSFDKNALLQAWQSELIAPAWQEVAAQGPNLATKVNLFLAQPSNASLTDAREAWRQAARAWGAAEPFVFGEMKSQYLHWSIGRSPANSSSIESSISDRSRTLDSLYMRQQSSYAKSLSAIEYLLFADSSQQLPFSARRADYLRLAVQHLALEMQKPQDIWENQGEGQRFAAAEGYELGSAISELSNGMINLAQEMSRKKLGKPLGKENDGIFLPESVEHPDAHFSIGLLKANFEGLEDAFLLGRPNLQAYWESESSNEVPAQFAANLRAAIRLCESLGDDLQAALQNQPEEVEQLYDLSRAIYLALSNDMAAVFGITVLPSDNDGD